MKVKELITRLLDEPMDAEVMLCTDYDKEKVKDYGNVREVSRGVIFDIDEIEHWAENRVNINFTDWRKGADVETEPYKLADALMEERIRGKLHSDTIFEKDIIRDVKCRLTVSIRDHRPCYCGAELREVWREVDSQESEA